VGKESYQGSHILGKKAILPATFLVEFGRREEAIVAGVKDGAFRAGGKEVLAQEKKKKGLGKQTSEEGKRMKTKNFFRQEKRRSEFAQKAISVYAERQWIVRKKNRD